jgi:hypothetical protein
MATTNEQADRIFTEYRRQVELVRANKSLSREGRRASLADIYLTSKEKMAAVFEKENGQREARRQVLERALFGISELRGDPASLTISRRDAMDRVEKVETTDQALALLARATGDEVLARTVAQWGYERRNADVVNAFLETRPELDADFNELWSLPAGSSVSEIDRAMRYPIDLPPELHGVSEMDLRAISEGRELARSR